MNQILENKQQNLEINKKKDKKNILLTKYKLQFIFCLIILLISLSIYSIYMYKLNKKENISHKLLNKFNITSLYSNDNDYNLIKTSINNNNENSNKVYVIGLLEIDSINLTYPILSNVSNEYLKISPCRFFGPMPNEIGNLCIAGHNYKNYKFFSRLNDVKINDIISIQDLVGKKINYIVYKKYNINADEFDCTNQNTNGKREVTLITCNNINNSKRIVIKAKETD